MPAQTTMTHCTFANFCIPASMSVMSVFDRCSLNGVRCACVTPRLTAFYDPIKDRHTGGMARRLVPLDVREFMYNLYTCIKCKTNPWHIHIFHTHLVCFNAPSLACLFILWPCKLWQIPVPAHGEPSFATVFIHNAAPASPAFLCKWIYLHREYTERTVYWKRVQC